MNSVRAVKEITKLLPMICPSGQLPPTCQQVIDARDRGDWLTALMLVEQECGSPSCDGAYAQAMAVEGTIWHAQGELKQALSCYQIARDEFGLRRNIIGEAVMWIAIGTIHELDSEMSNAQNAYQEARTRFEEICVQTIDREDETLRSWCRSMRPILDTCLKSGHPNWIPRLESAAAGHPQRYVLQEWERIHYKTRGRIQIEDTTYELQSVTRKTRRRIKLDPAVEYFNTKAQGVSMIGAGIHDGDLLLVQTESRPENGQIAVVVEERDDGEVSLVKRLRYDDQWIYLESENPAYQTRTFKRGASGLRILGTVLAVLKEIPTDDSEA